MFGVKRNDMAKTENIMVKVSPEEKQRFKQIAKDNNTTMSDFIRNRMEQFENLEQYMDHRFKTFKESLYNEFDALTDLIIKNNK